MIDWMVEVLTVFKKSDATYFVAINILTTYFKAMDKPVPQSDLHILGIVCMLIASKYEDVVPLSMKTVIEKIGHSKYTRQ